jgi:2-polyprenyl-3-methyl-5-hydroxy-6-metoxy-1,4-benzoquinol methylase
MTSDVADARCRLCDGGPLQAGLRAVGLPVHTVVLCGDARDAQREPTGDLVLVCCENCGFVFNAAYRADLQDYGSAYESTQSFSPTFNQFNRALAAEISARIDNRGGAARGEVVEVGCGQGEFLALLREHGCQNLRGFDPAFDPARSAVAHCDDIPIDAGWFEPSAQPGTAAAIVCKMTLEHVERPVALLEQCAALAARAPGCELFVQVPNATDVFGKRAFWDLHYEHCNYFSSATLGEALRRAGFVPSEIRSAYEGQYLLARATLDGEWPPASDATRERAEFDAFCASVQAELERWRGWVHERAEAGARVMLWGGGSKAVAFVSFTATAEDLVGAIDINPRKADTYLPGSGLPVRTPEQAASLDPSDIVLLNPIYLEEVERQSAAAGIRASIHTLQS